MTQEYYRTYKKSLELQGVQLTDALEPNFEKRSEALVYMTTGLIGFILGMFFLAGVRYCDKVKEVPVQQNCVGCHRQIAFTDYFKKAGSKTPEEMANAVINSKNPRLLAAIAKVESGGNPHIRRAGFKKRHDGAYQVNAKYWGTVGASAAEQTKQAEAILEELAGTSKNIRIALNQYGGDTQGKYAEKVLYELTRVP